MIAICILLAAALITSAFFQFINFVQWLQGRFKSRRPRRLQELNPDLLKKN
jgi:hypothetical protein